MNSVTKKWMLMKISSAILLPLMIWFILNLVLIFDKDYTSVINFFTTQPSKTLFSSMLVFAYLFSALSISEVFEDYIHDKKIKDVANKVLNIFAITIPLITIIIIFNLN
jgi:succinate dehydrogenase / fumarate reductase membrane anchor subunit|tara:strand:+ start:169 stop:495 length:327 start_codon:yes stop_codon:yes gene_type:complete